jgi:hypothetical protein
MFGAGVLITIIAIVGGLTFNKLEDLDKKVDQLSAINAISDAKLPEGENTAAADPELGEEESNSQIARLGSGADRSAAGHTQHAQNSAVHGDNAGAETQYSSPLHAQSARTQGNEHIAASQPKALNAENALVQSVENANTDLTNNASDKNPAAIELRHAVNADALSFGSEALVLTPVQISPFELEQRIGHVSQVAVPELIRQDKPGQMSVYALAGHTFSSFRMVNVGTPVFSLTGYDKSYSGVHAGLGMNYSLTRRLRLDVNVMMSELQNRSTYRDKMQYHKANETTDINGQLIYREQMQMESPIGQFVNEAQFSLDGKEIAEESEMDNYTSIKQDFTVAVLQAGLDYLFLQRGRVSAFLGGGMGVNYFFGLDQCMNTRLSFEGSKLMDASYDMKPGSNSNATYLSLYGRAGVEYRLGARLVMRLQGHYDRSLGSIRHPGSDSDVKTYLNSFRTSLVVGYSF